LHSSAVLRTIVAAFVTRAAGLDLQRAADHGNELPAVVDLGCGSGEVLAELARRCSINGVGIDLSTAAVALAAKQFPELTWLVGNADRRLPLLDGRVDLVLSLHGRRNPPECARVLDRHRFLLVAIPAPDDLIELREMVQGAALQRDRTELLLAEHAPHFRLLEHFGVREQQRLARPVLLDLLRGTYRGERGSAAERVAALDDLQVTLASAIFLFARR
jgi:SAM-dependent methyltransferase